MNGSHFMPLDSEPPGSPTSSKDSQLHANPLSSPVFRRIWRRNIGRKTPLQGSFRKWHTSETRDSKTENASKSWSSFLLHLVLKKKNTSAELPQTMPYQLQLKQNTKKTLKADLHSQLKNSHLRQCHTQMSPNWTTIWAVCACVVAGGDGLNVKKNHEPWDLPPNVSSELEKHSTFLSSILAQNMSKSQNIILFRSLIPISSQQPTRP